MPPLISLLIYFYFMTHILNNALVNIAWRWEINCFSNETDIVVEGHMLKGFFDEHCAAFSATINSYNRVYVKTRLSPWHKGLEQRPCVLFPTRNSVHAYNKHYEFLKALRRIFVLLSFC